MFAKVKKKFTNTAEQIISLVDNNRMIYGNLETTIKLLRSIMRKNLEVKTFTQKWSHEVLIGNP